MLCSHSRPEAVNGYLPAWYRHTPCAPSLRHQARVVVQAEGIRATVDGRTLTVEVRGEYLFIHWINVKAEDVAGASELVGGRFERHVKAICE